MKNSSGMAIFPLALFIAGIAFSPAQADNQNAFSRGDTLHLGDVDVLLGEDKSRWGATRQGNIELGRNTFLFGREDTYESIVTRNGIESPTTGTTIGVGMGFSF